MEKKVNKITQTLPVDSIIESLPDPVFWQDLNLVIQGCNKHMAKLFGFNTTDAMVGTTPLEFRCKAAESAPKFMELDKRTMETQQILNSIIIDIFADDVSSAHLVKKSPILDDGQVVGVLTQGISLNQNTPLVDIGVHLARIDAKRHSNQTACYMLKDQVDDFKLSNRETECLFYLMRGKTMREIADFLFLSPRTAEFHVATMKQKMNCQTKSELIEKSIANGYMNIIPKRLLSRRLILIL